MKKKQYSTVDNLGKWFDSRNKRKKREEKADVIVEQSGFAILRGHLVETIPIQPSPPIVKPEKKTRKYRENSKRVQPIQHGAYIQSELWEKRKDSYYKNHKKQCARCNSFKYINLHHMFYDSKIFGQEPDDHLIPLCWQCHEKFHFNYKTKKNMILDTKEFISTYKEFGELLSVGIKIPNKEILI